MKYHVFQDASGRWRWHLRTGGRVLAQSAGGHPDKDACMASLATFMRAGPDTPILEE